MLEPTCSIDGCDGKHYGRGWCKMHYGRWKRRGDPLSIGIPGNPNFRTGGPSTAAVCIPDSLVDKDGPGGCWMWLGHINASGYGRTSVNRRRWLAHRYFYTVTVGPIPDGLHLDHLCRVRACVNPAHLEPVTPRENLARSALPWVEAVLRNNTCMKGHPLEGDNLVILEGARACRTCRRDRKRKSRHR